MPQLRVCRLCAAKVGATYLPQRVARSGDGTVGVQHRQLHRSGGMNINNAVAVAIVQFSIAYLWAVRESEARSGGIQFCILKCAKD